mmetsp:Transcript_37489/g.93194  ORF Transcript_37489/g.93194 Transcript_37489/m.93194 type:complete len:232 (+) Transcript_37489:551-1246(+)
MLLDPVAVAFGPTCQAACPFLNCARVELVMSMPRRPTAMTGGGCPAGRNGSDRLPTGFCFFRVFSVVSRNVSRDVSRDESTLASRRTYSVPADSLKPRRSPHLRQKRASASWICRPHWSHSRPSQIFGRIARVPLAPWFTSTVGPKLAPGKEEDGAPPMPAACLLPRLVVAAAVAAPMPAPITPVIAMAPKPKPPGPPMPIGLMVGWLREPPPPPLPLPFRSILPLPPLRS